jgi:hypothetical protein
MAPKAGRGKGRGGGGKGDRKKKEEKGMHPHHTSMPFMPVHSRVENYRSARVRSFSPPLNCSYC